MAKLCKVFHFRSLHKKCPDTELFLVRIQSEYRKIRTRNNSVFGHSSRSERFAGVLATLLDILRKYQSLRKMKFSIKDFFSKCDQIIRRHLLKQSLKETFIFCTVNLILRKIFITSLN